MAIFACLYGVMKWNHHNEFCNIMNVYSPCDLASKRVFWEEANIDVLGHSDDLWCVVGDFNSIMRMEERRGSSSNWVYNECIEFSSFVEDMELFDLPLVGSKLTWFFSNGLTMSRLDRFLVNNACLQRWGRLFQTCLKRTFSYHCPLLLKKDVQNWGPTPLRTNNCWFSDPTFSKFVNDSWNELRVQGRGSYVLKEKLKLLKGVLKVWNKNHFGDLGRRINDQVNLINVLDGKGSSGILADVDIVAR
ncbi:unnamed protein product [Lupinus luteus]|uniref:Reverse transcriptase n=1 Tax=Lupinus luteus TaxID=3873 RepID=A0AAV1WFF1_LUPLU